MIDKLQEKILVFFAKNERKSMLAAVVFHIIYSFVFATIIGGKNPLLFLHKNGYTTIYMILMPILASLPYILSGYLITLARNRINNLSLKSKELFKKTSIVILAVYIISLILQFIFPFRNMYGVFKFINYPAASYLIEMSAKDYTFNYLVLISAIMPPIMTYIGAMIRINILKKEGLYE